MSQYTSYIGVGLYAVPEAARILGLEPSKLRRWINEFRSFDDASGPHPLIQRTFTCDPVLSFADLIELLFIKMFRSEGVSMRTIRKAAYRASREFGSSHPFAACRFDNDGRHIFATLKAECGKSIEIEDVARGQRAFDTVVRPFFRKLDYDEQCEVVAYWPRHRSGRVVLDPRRQFGKPIDAETSIPTDILYAAYMTSECQSLDEVANWFDVPVDAVVASVEYESSLQSA